MRRKKIFLSFLKGRSLLSLYLGKVQESNMFRNYPWTAKRTKKRSTNLDMKTSRS